MIRNVHERVLPVPIEEIGSLLDRLGGPDDVLWPSPAWDPMVLDGPVAVGAVGGHGPRAGKVEFTADPSLGLVGTHTFAAEPAPPAWGQHAARPARVRGARVPHRDLGR